MSPSARGAWVALEQQFIGNRETRVLLVDTEFRTLKQGALSVNDYCRRMKSLADSLTELGETVTDRALAMNVLRGISDRFDTLRLFLKKQLPFPFFVEIRSELQLEELTMAPPAVSPTALVAGQAAPPTSAPPASALVAGAPAPPPTGSSKNRRRRSNSKSGGAAPSTGGAAVAPAAGGFPWPSVYNPL